MPFASSSGKAAGGDPRVVEDVDGRYVLTYTAYDGKTARLCVSILAGSSDVDQARAGLQRRRQWALSRPVVQVGRDCLRNARSPTRGEAG